MTDDHSTISGHNGMVLIAPAGTVWSLPENTRDRLKALQSLAAHNMETKATGVITSCRLLSPTVLHAEVSYSVSTKAAFNAGLLSPDPLTPKEN